MTIHCFVLTIVTIELLLIVTIFVSFYRKSCFDILSMKSLRSVKQNEGS